MVSFLDIDTLCSELDRERKARYAIQHKLKGNADLPPLKKTPQKEPVNTLPRINMQVFLFLNVDPSTVFTLGISRATRVFWSWKSWCYQSQKIRR